MKRKQIELDREYAEEQSIEHYLEELEDKAIERERKREKMRRAGLNK
jgi:hypothetical protein